MGKRQVLMESFDECEGITMADNAFIFLNMGSKIGYDTHIRTKTAIKMPSRPNKATLTALCTKCG